MDKNILASKLNLDILLTERCPYGHYEVVDVKFEGANADFIIPHSLNPEHPQDVQYSVLRQTTDGVVYEATDANWTNDYIILRASTASWCGRLLLSVLTEQRTFNPLTL